MRYYLSTLAGCKEMWRNQFVNLAHKNVVNILIQLLKQVAQ